MTGLLVRPHPDLNVAIERREKRHQPVDGIFPEAAFEHARDFRLGDAHALAGRRLCQLAFLHEPVNLDHDLRLEEMRLGVGQPDVGEDVAASDFEFDLAGHDFQPKHRAEYECRLIFCSDEVYPVVTEQIIDLPASSMA